MKRTLIGMIAALLALAGQALAKDQKPLELASFMKPEVSAGAQAMAYAPEMTGALPRVVVTAKPMRALVIGGLGWPATSYVNQFEDDLKALGYEVDIRGPGNWAELDLSQYRVLVGHSLGGRAALQAPAGTRLIITIDPYLAGWQRCPVGAQCVNYYNAGHSWLGFGPVRGAENIDCLVENCGIASMIPVVGHMTVSASRTLQASVLAQVAGY